ncbi:MAG: RHS repeat-associated core domain-containing protein [Kiritimatiellae bacterium]|nr:RHS repeat-associated core domain-containing protein [Kiritimatiellia bacterium]
MNGETNRSLYHEWPVLEVRDGENSRLETHTHSRDLSGAIGGVGGIGGILSVAHTGESEPWRYYHADGNGNIVLLTDKDEEETARIEYDPFGRVLINTASQPVRYQFSSKEVDSAVGLNYYGYRYYSPELGRWINRDPVEERGGINLYSFIVNSPLSHADYLGLRNCCPEELERARAACFEARIALGLALAASALACTPPSVLIPVFGPLGCSLAVHAAAFALYQERSACTQCDNQ